MLSKKKKQGTKLNVLGFFFPLQNKERFIFKTKTNNLNPHPNVSERFHWVLEKRKLHSDITCKPGPSNRRAQEDIPKQSLLMESLERWIIFFAFPLLFKLTVMLYNYNRMIKK